jgi:CarboxypepD_reg-like domain/TonB-dependent Receptor Plug Domain
MKALLILFFGIILSQKIFPQPSLQQFSKITGSISDERKKHPLSFANVFIKGENIGATATEKGEFTLEKLPNGNHTLVISYVGYIQKEIEIIIKDNLPQNLGQILLSENSITLKEVVVSPGSFSVMDTKNISKLSISEKDLKNMSWAEDLTRAVARLPGVSSNDFSSKFTVRGGEADEVLMTLDGMELYEPFHQRDFVGGLFSIVDIETIRSVDLLTGGFSSEFGQRQSGVFQMKTKVIPFDTKHTSIGLSAMNARLYKDGRFAKNKGSYMISARRGMLDLTFKAIGANETSPKFYDAMAKFEYNLNERHQLSLHILHAGDKTAIRDIKPGNFDVHDTKYTNSYSWLSLNSQLKPKISVRTIAYTGQISHNRNGLFHKYDFTDKGDFKLTDIRTYSFVGFKQDLNYDFSDKIELKIGFDFRQLKANYSYKHHLNEVRVNKNDSLYVFDRNVEVASRPNGRLFNWYISSRFQLMPKLFFEAGLRYDGASYAQDQLWSPRLSAVYSFSKNTFLRAAWGYYYQSQFINNLDVNHNGTKFNPAELSVHNVIGFEHNFKKGISLRIEAYKKDISRISPIYQNLRDPWEVFPESRNDVVKLNIDGAKAKGLEFFVKYDQGKKISWWLRYALANAIDNIKNIEYDGIYIEQLGKQLRPNNQFHTIYADLNYRIDKKWHLSTAWQFYNGWPRTTYNYFSQKLPNGDLHFYQKHEAFNGVQYPAYHRMDFRINRHFQLKKGKISGFAHFINIYNRSNLKKFDLGIGVDENGSLIPNGNGTYLITRDDTNWFGITPVVGLSWDF